VGGIIGIILAWVIASVVGAIAAASGTPIEPVIGIDAILLATLFSMAVGLLFGIYPANRAAAVRQPERFRGCCGNAGLAGRNTPHRNAPA
jgi:putative ABC transport system permease protein